MKKIALMVCVLMLFSIVACADNGKGNTNVPGTGQDVTDDGNGNANGNTNGNANGNADDDAVIDDENNGSGGANGGNGEKQKLTGKAQGYGGEVTVTVEVNGNDIISVDAVGEKETQGVGSNALEQLPDKIAEANSTDVEVVSGATVTSKAIKEAVDKALETRK